LPKESFLLPYFNSASRRTASGLVEAGLPFSPAGSPEKSSHLVSPVDDESRVPEARAEGLVFRENRDPAPPNIGGFLVTGMWLLNFPCPGLNSAGALKGSVIEETSGLPLPF